MYAGDHWFVARSLLEVAPDLDLWVASGGYGLIRADHPIKPYRATFSPGSDCVAAETHGRAEDADLRAWWAVLAEAPLVDRTPRSVEQLAASDPASILVVSASQTYLRALRDDLIRARSVLAAPDQLVIVSAGTKAFPGLDENLLPIGAEVQAALGGPRMSLNVRIVRHLLLTRSEHGWHHKAATSVLLGLTSDRAPRIASRQRLSDGEATEFIRKSLREVENPSKSRLLFELRRQGFACEQNRFGELYAIERSS